MADFAAVVRRFMQARGLSLRALARSANYDPSYLSKVLSGQKPVTPYLGACLDDAGVRSFAGSLLGDKESRRHADVVVTAGWLSALLAISATDLGDHPAALVWCTDTERRGNDAGHPELAGWAALTRALIAYYQGQAEQSASCAAQGQHVSAPGTVVHAKLAAQEMRSRAMLGDTAGIAEARRKATASAGALSPGFSATGVFSIPLEEDPPYTATSLLLVGRYQEAAEATRRIIDGVYGGTPGEQPAKYARTLLILALAQAGLGRADAAAAAGSGALDCGRPAWPTMVLAEKLDRRLAASFPNAAVIGDYRARYTEATAWLSRAEPHPAITQGLPS